MQIGKWLDRAGRRIWRTTAGNMAMSFAVMAPVLFGLVGGGVDFAMYLNFKYALQEAADSAAIAAAREASLSGWTERSALGVVNTYLDTNVRKTLTGTIVAAVSIDQSQRQVAVTVDQDFVPYFVLGYFQHTPQIRVNAVAQASNSTNICVIGLDGADTGTVTLTNKARLEANRCAVYSNSASTTGLVTDKNAYMAAELVCSAGGYQGAPSSFSSSPLTDCPTVTDPLSARPAPEIGQCRERDAVYSGFVGELMPGVYCGGLTITANSRVVMRPGIYVFKDGPFKVGSNSQVDAIGVGMYFTGKNAFFEFVSNSVVNAEAPRTGAMAGLIVFQDHAADEQDFLIKSNATRNLLGTIYLPNGNLVVDANNKVADQSAYTAIVVRRLKLSNEPNLVLNSNYDQTDVPVPDGVGPNSSKVRLVN